MRGAGDGLGLAVGLALAALTSLPYALAEQRPPAGTGFTGALFYRDDFYQYLSFAEQAGRGAFLLGNKFDPEARVPVLVNLEWWTAGVVGRLLGRPVAAFHLLRAAAVVALVLAASRLLAMAGLSGLHRAWGLLLFATGAGLGALRLVLGTPSWQIPDLLMGLFPFHQALSNPHFVVGTALLLWAVVLHLEWRRGGRRRWWWLAVAWALGLCRPYDLVPLGAIVFGLGALDLARGRGPRPLLDLLWLAPLPAYYAFVVGRASFGGWGTQAIDLSPPPGEFLFALGPAALAVLVWGRRRPEEPTLRHALALWCGALLALLVLWPSPMAKQCLTSLGGALLLWATAATPAPALPALVLVLAPTSGLLLRLAFVPQSDSFAPTDYFAATRELRSACAPSDLALAPTDLSLLIAGLTPCRVALGHRLLTPRFAEAVAEGDRFYHDTATDPAWRLAYLGRKGARFVVLPNGGGPLLGASPPFERILTRPLLEVWRRTGAAGATS